MAHILLITMYKNTIKFDGSSFQFGLSFLPFPAHAPRAIFLLRRAIDFVTAPLQSETHTAFWAQRHKREWTRNNSSEAVSNKSITLIVLPQRRSLALPHSETCSMKHEMKYSAFMNKSLTITNTAEIHSSTMNAWTWLWNAATLWTRNFFWASHCFVTYIRGYGEFLPFFLHPR